MASTSTGAQRWGPAPDVTVAEHAALCDRGLRRADNQDRVLNRPPVFAVADGIGGARGGAVAAQMAVDALDQLAGDRCASAPLGLAVRAVNRDVHARAQHDPSLGGMGTTLTAMRVAETTLELAHVGDSRAYRLSGGALERLTADDSVVEELVRRGTLTPEQAARHPLRSVSTRAVGARSGIEVTTRTVVPHRGDLFLLCSDGLTTVLTDRNIAALLRGSATLRQAAGALVAAANARGGPDNVAVVLFRVGASPAWSSAGTNLSTAAHAGLAASSSGDQF